jgi:CrcB protein
MRVVLAISVGASIGANLRFFISIWVAQTWGNMFPYGTLLINVVGSVLIGVFYALADSRPAMDPTWRPLLVTGLLGGFTTFSSFSYETYALAMRGAWLAVMLYVAGSVGLGLVGVVLGVLVVRWFGG